MNIKFLVKLGKSGTEKYYFWKIIAISIYHLLRFIIGLKFFKEKIYTLIHTLVLYVCFQKLCLYKKDPVLNRWKQ